jgi:ATP-dependent DNA helicase DinG
MSALPPVEGPATLAFSEDAARAVANEIRDAGDVEVFFIGRRDRTGLVVEVESHAYGVADQVPAILRSARPGDVAIHNHPSGFLMPSSADLEIASILGNNGVGSYIVDNECRRYRVVVRPTDEKRTERLDEEEVLARLGPGSHLAKTVGDWEDRPAQREMAAAVTRAFNGSGIAVVEAGTGVGKSLAYLVPAVLYALANKERVVISTATINLQEQLLHKDIPALRLALGQTFTAELVKGRGNYVCKRKAQMARDSMEFLAEPEVQRELEAILPWELASPTGDRGDLPFEARHEAWERVASEADNCLRVRCPFYEKCHFYNSRRRAARADVLIVNHSLLLGDLAVRRDSDNWSAAAVLPPYRHVILDEAHHLEESAIRYFARQLSKRGLQMHFMRLFRPAVKGAAAQGALVSLRQALDDLASRGEIDPAAPAVVRFVTDGIARVPDVLAAIEYLLDEFTERFLEAANLPRPRRGQEHKVRITARHRREDTWDGSLVPLLRAMVTELQAFIAPQRALIKELADLVEEHPPALRDALLEWNAVLGRIDEQRGLVADFVTGKTSACQWVEIYAGPQERPVTRLCDAPIDVAPIFAETLHERVRTEVLASATMTVDGRFEFVADRIGLRARAPKGDSEPEARAPEMLRLESPFDYQGQAFLGVPADLGDPRAADFDTRFAAFAGKAIATSDGRAFVLFTSHGAMERSHRMLASDIRRLGYTVLKQGEEGRDALLRKFREDESSVLFATSSFWEGVDVRGRALELVIIHKLPFAVPTDPVQEAQYEAMKAAGRDPFDGLVVPRAVIRFKQGFGRLIRSKTDRGAVLIADGRLVTARYGQRFLRSLPPVPVVHAPAAELMARLGAFLRPAR